jgi:bla regulator protein blaR1
VEMNWKAMWLLLAAGACASAQKSFDVASIKPNAANDNRVMIRIQPGGRFTATGVSIKALLGQALGVRDFQILNAPGWASAERWDINAVSEGLPERVPPEVLRPLLRSLLEERCQLKMHTETRELPIYTLVVGKNGPKLKASESASPQRMMRMGRGEINGQGVPMAFLVQQLGQMLGRDVTDKTGLAGVYDFELTWTPEPGQGGGGPFGGGPPNPDALPGAGAGGPSIFTAVQEQLGLRLEPAKGPVQVYVVDNIARPSEN